MEVYVDDMLVKSQVASEHIAYLTKMFDILWLYRIKLNPLKCSFGVSSGKFLGYMVKNSSSARYGEPHQQKTGHVS